MLANEPHCNPSSYAIGYLDHNQKVRFFSTTLRKLGTANPPPSLTLKDKGTTPSISMATKTEGETIRRSRFTGRKSISQFNSDVDDEGLRRSMGETDSGSAPDTETNSRRTSDSDSIFVFDGPNRYRAGEMRSEAEKVNGDISAPTGFHISHCRTAAVTDTGLSARSSPCLVNSSHTSMPSSQYGTQLSPRPARPPTSPTPSPASPAPPRPSSHPNASPRSCSATGLTLSTRKGVLPVRLTDQKPQQLTDDAELEQSLRQEAEDQDAKDDKPTRTHDEETKLRARFSKSSKSLNGARALENWNNNVLPGLYLPPFISLASYFPLTSAISLHPASFF